MSEIRAIAPLKTPLSSIIGEEANDVMIFLPFFEIKLNSNCSDIPF